MSSEVLLKIWKKVSAVTVAVFALAVVFLGGMRLLGFTPYAIMSGSMSPKYKVGSLVYVKKTDPLSIEADDVITYVAGSKSTVVTHRVIAVDRENRLFRTKGDANKAADTAPVLYENVLGRVSFSVPLIGYVSMLLLETSGKLLALSVFFLICLLLFLPDLLKIIRKK